MKLALLILGTSVLLAGSGGLLLYKASRYSIDEREADLNQPRHLITQQMELETSAMKQRKEPSFQLSTENGKMVSVAIPEAKLPGFIYFIKDDCPCSIDAQPLFNRLAVRYQGKIEFVGVIDGDVPVAKKFASLYSAAFPIIPDKREVVIHGFQAKGGIYCALVARNGHLIKMWPGYSASLLQEMNHYLAGAAGVPEVPFDPEYAPKQKAAGCAFSSTGW